MSQIIGDGRSGSGGPTAIERVATKFGASMTIVVWVSLGLIGALRDVHAEDPVEDESRVASLTVLDFCRYDEQLESFVEIALLENPRILSAWSGVESRYQRAPQARSLPDLNLQYRYFAQSPETRVGPQEHAFEISQGVPWKGKRGLQADRANLLASSVAWQAQDLERTVIADLKRAYFGAAFLQEALTINAEERELLHRFESIALKRYATGSGIQQSVVKVQTEITRLDVERTDIQERLDSAVRRIATLVGRPDQEIDLVPIQLEMLDSSLDVEELEQAAVVTHPRVRSIERRIEADDVWSKRAALERRPDFKFGLGYTFVGNRDDPAAIAMPPEDNGQNILALTAGINIPLHGKRIRAGIAEAEASRRASSEFLEAERDSLLYGIQESVLRLESISERSDLYNEVLIPQAGAVLASAEAAYTTNKLGFLDLLDAERVLFKVRLNYRRLLSDYWMALSDLEHAVGRPVPCNPEEPGTRSER